MSRDTSASISRRHFLEASVLAGLGVALARPPGAAEAAAASLPLITKAIPVSGEKLAAIGLGTDAFNEDARADIRDEIQRMTELGGSVIDTAASYGDSEALIGDALATPGTRNKIFLATKLVAGGFGVTGVDSLERSMQRLKTQRIDLLQVHNLDGVATLIPLMQQWKQQQKIRYIGITTSRVGQHADLIAAMRTYPLDFIQVDYSIGNREAAEAVLPLAQQRRLAVLINLPFGRSSLFRQAAERQLPSWAADIDVSSWAQFFLKYVISHPAVTCAIPGSTKVSHLVDNQGAGRGRLPDAAMRRKMEQYWDNRS